MAAEIERKFLVANDSWRDMARASMNITQAYISHRPDGIVRLRLTDSKAWLTVKGRTRGISRNEWEYEIPIEDAREMIDHHIYEGSYLSKTRYLVDYKGRTWEIDEFHKGLKGLVLAEVELPSVETEVELPPFIGEEVSGNPEYYNSNLMKKLTS